MIQINNLTSENIDNDFLKKIVEVVLQKEKGKILPLSIVFLDSGKIKNLNKKYRKKNIPTDVLSFSYKNDIIEFENKEDSLIGEIVLCPEMIKKNAQKFKKDYKDELMWALIHGLLHLLGYNHKKEQEAKKMRKKEKRYLNFLKK